MKYKWTRDTISEVIKTCSSVKDFRRRYPGAYSAMNYNNWIDLKHLIKGYNPDSPHGSPGFIWTRETVIQAMQTCSSKPEFNKKYKYAYNAIKRNGWEDLYSYFPDGTTYRSWDKESVADAISKCKSIYQFRTEYPRAYSAMERKGWRDLIDGMPQYSDINDETPCWSVYRWLFTTENTVYIGLTNNFRRRVKEELASETASPICNYIHSHPWATYQVTELHSNLHSDEAANFEIAYIAQYKKAGYTMLNRNRGGSLGSYSYRGMYSSMTDEQILESAIRRYDTFAKFKRGSKLMYNEIRRRGLIDSIASVLPVPMATPPAHTRESIATIIHGCKNYAEFRTKHQGAYNAMKRNAWDDLAATLTKGRLYPTKDELQPTFSDILAQVNQRSIGLAYGARCLGLSERKFREYAGTELARIRKTRKNDVVRCSEAPRLRKRSNESIISEVTSKYTKLADLAKNQTLLMMVKRHGLYKQVSSLLQHTHRLTITRDDVSDAVKQCTTYAEFQQKFPSEYQVAHHNHWDDLIKDLPRKNKKASDFSYEHIHECAHQCSTRTEFNKKFRSESYAAKKLGIYDEIVADMPKQSKWSKQKVTAPTDTTGVQN